MSTMTLNDVRDWHRVQAKAVRSSELASQHPEAVERQARRHDECADAIDAALTSREAKGEAVAWQYRVTRDGGGYVDWQPWDREDRPEMIGRWKAEYRPLYDHPAVREAAKPVEAKGDVTLPDWADESDKGRLQDSIKFLESWGLTVHSASRKANVDTLGDKLRALVAEASDDEWSNQYFTMEVVKLVESMPLTEVANS